MLLMGSFQDQLAGLGAVRDGEGLVAEGLGFRV